MKLTRILGALTVSLLAFGANPVLANNTITADHCWIRHMPAAVPSGGFFEAHNNSAKDVQLSKVKSADYGMVMLHETKTVDGVSKMSMVHDINIPANGTLSFKPGGYHLMLEQPREGIVVGDNLKLEFELSNGDKFTAQCEVKSPKDLSGVNHDHSAHH